MFRFSLLTASTLGLVITSADAEGLFSREAAESGLYISGFVGGAYSDDARYTGTQNPEAGVPGTAGAGASINSDFDDTTIYGGAVGYQLPFTYWKYFHPRVEFEISNFDADVSNGSFNGNDLNFSGNQDVTSYLINSYSDIVWSEDQTLVPFIGGGIGISNVDGNILYQGGAPGAPNPTFGLLGDDTALTTTIGGGLTLRANKKFEVYGEARYTQIYGVELERRFIPNGGLNANVEDDISNSALIIGARVRF